MKVILGANISANGKVLLEENTNHQVPQEATEFLIQIAIQAGNLIIGRKTFEIVEQLTGGIKQALSGIEIVLLSANDGLANDLKVVGTPQEAINYLTEKGFKEIAVGGGTQTYNAFLDQDLVTDIHFNIVPILTGIGGVLVTNDELVTRFKLTEHKVLSQGVVQLHLTKS
jgi:dihydrofolate reductase